MSQIYRSTSAGPSPPDVATSYTTDNGTAVPSANVLQVNAIDVTDNNVNGIQTTGGLAEAGASNRVQVELTNRLQGTATSTNASNADIITFALDAANPMVYRFNFDVSGRSTAGNFTGEGVGYRVLATARTDGAAATIIETPFIDADEDTNLMGASIDFIASGNNVILRAVGIAAETISYGAVGYYLEV